MTQDEKIKYMTIAANVVGFNLRVEHSDLLISLYEAVLEKQGDLDLKSIAEIEDESHNRIAAKNRSKLLDHVSEKA